MEPRKVLVVEDSKLLHQIYEVMLRRPLIHARDGREALDLLDVHPDVDLILLDLNMPRMNGFEFLAHVKAHPRFASIPVVIVSIEGREECTDRGLRAGAAAYLKKPFRNEALMEIIARIGASR